MRKNVLHNQITSPAQDRVIGIVIVGAVAFFVAYALQSATESTLAEIDYNIASAIESRVE